jgi:cGMP-dependent protein kinase
MGSCSLKRTEGQEQVIKIIAVTNHLATNEEEKKIDNSFGRVRSGKSKQKAPLHEIRKGSIPQTDAPTAVVKDVVKTQKDIQMIQSFFEKHFIFNTLTSEHKRLVIEAMKLYVLASGQIIFRQNQPGNNFFIVTSGILEVIINEERKNTINEGQGFGELALMHDTPRTATVKTLTATSLWGLDRGTFKRLIEDLNVMNYQENKAFIESVTLFTSLSQSQKDALVGSLNTLNFSPGQVIVKEGDIGDLLYIVKEGSVSCFRGGSEIKKFTKGEYFGDQALIYNSPRTATCVAISQVVCLSIDRTSLNSALGSHLQQIIFKNSQSIIINRDNYLKKLSEIQSNKMIDSMLIQNFKPSEVIIPKDSSKCDQILMILKGKALYGEVYLEKFECVGVTEMIECIDLRFEFDLVAFEETDVARIDRNGFEKSIGGAYLNVTLNNEALKILKQVQILRGVSDEKLAALKDAMKVESFAPGQVIVEQNSEGNAFFIIKKGKVQVSIDGHVVREITKLDYFGERSVIFNQKRTASVIACENVECWVLFQKDFLRIIDQGLRNQLMKRIELQDDNLILEDLVIARLLGKGMFGNVFLAVHKNKKIFYALKTVDRKKIAAYELYESLVLERKILLQLDHIFIMKLVKTLKDDKRIYFVLEYVRGMDLFDVLRNMQIVSEEDSKFYTACLIIILQHLHEREIIYRDLKPENIVVDEEGYLKLIDFGTAKLVKGRTYTIVGTPHYMAPEVILRKGYGVASDYWSLGILLYELLFERVPFADEEEDPMIIYEIILTSKLRYPRLPTSMNNVKSIINQLLNKNPSHRMGSGFEKLKTSPWFSMFSWEKLLSKELPAPYLPKIKKFDLDLVIETSSKKSLESVFRNEEQDEIPMPTSKAPEGWDEEF